MSFIEQLIEYKKEATPDGKNGADKYPKASATDTCNKVLLRIHSKKRFIV
jgi:hypothetical protein